MRWAFGGGCAASVDLDRPGQKGERNEEIVAWRCPTGGLLRYRCGSGVRRTAQLGSRSEGLQPQLLLPARQLAGRLRERSGA